MLRNYRCSYRPLTQYGRYCIGNGGPNYYALELNIRSKLNEELTGLGKRISAMNVNDVWNSISVNVVDKLSRVQVHDVYFIITATVVSPQQFAGLAVHCLHRL